MADTPLASADVASALHSLENSHNAAGYNELLNSILSNSLPDTIAPNLIAYVQSLLGESVGIVTSRPLFATFVEKYKELTDPEVKVEVGNRVLELLEPKVVSYEEQDTKIKEALADAYQEQEDFIGAAKVLQRITLDTSQRTVSDDDKAGIWIRIVRCYLEEDDPTSAMSYLNRVKNVLYNVRNPETRLNFQASQARIYDSQRQFLDASEAYHAVSFEKVIAEEDRLQSLSSAIVCAVLAPAGPRRSRTLAKLYKDERSSQVEQYSILEKIFLDRLLSPEEVKAFAEKLAPHQLAKTADGSTVLEKAVLEHNLLGASRLYQNINFDRLGVLLGVDGEKAEEYAAQMIEQGRLAGYIDQIDRLIFFEGEGSGEKKVGQAERVVGKELRQWDANVQGLAEEVERITTMIQNEYPEFYTAHMVGA